MMGPGRMTVQLYERDPETLQSVQRSEDEVAVLAIVISHGDDMLQVGWDEDHEKWEIEVVGQSTIYHH